MPRTAALTVPLCLLGLLGACEGCDGKTPVPFKRAHSVSAPAAGRDAGRTTVQQAASITGTAYPDATHSIALDGATLERPDGAFRAALLRDLDDDGATDALLVTTDAQGRPELTVAMREGSELSQRAPLLLTPKAARCSVVSGKLEPFSSEHVLIVLEMRCEPPAAPAVTTQGTQGAPRAAPTALPVAVPAPGAPPEPEAPAVTHRYLASLEAAPRLLLHLAADAAQEGDPAELRISLRSEDRDQDQHPDLLLDLQVVSSTAAEPRSLTLSWLNRPSGLAREADEPEHALAALAGEAYRSVAAKPTSALTIAERALALHSMLCAESGRARLIVDGGSGLRCGPSAAAGKAAAARTIALSKARDILGALDASATLEDASYRVDAAQRDRVKKALSELPGDTRYVWLAGPSHDPARGEGLRVPAIGFVDEEHLLLRGRPSRSYDLTTGEVAPIALPTSPWISDGAGRAVTQVVRSCEGYHLRFSQVFGGSVSKTLGEPLIVADPLRDPASCARPSADAEHRFTVLGMSAQGVLLARGPALLLAPTDVSQGAAVARTLASTEPAPALLAPAALSANGAQHVLATSQGVALVTRGTTPSITLVRPPASCTGRISEPALSPSGAKLAMLCGGRVYVARSVGANEVPAAAKAASLAASALPDAPGSHGASAAPTDAPASRDPASVATPLTHLPPPEPEHPAPAPAQPSTTTRP